VTAFGLLFTPIFYVAALSWLSRKRHASAAQPRRAPSMP
jgi:hypothetical protein